MQDAAAAYDETSIHIRQTHVRCEWRGQRRRRQLRPTAANPSKYKMNYGQQWRLFGLCKREREGDRSDHGEDEEEKNLYTLSSIHLQNKWHTRTRHKAKDSKQRTWMHLSLPVLSSPHFSFDIFAFLFVCFFMIVHLLLPVPDSLRVEN